MRKKYIESEPKPCINILVNECWRCKNDMLVSYYDDGTLIPCGPSNFTEKQVAIASNAGCIIKESYSKTMQESYLANICPHCGAMIGDFFYHDYTYIPGDIQYFLDNEDNVIKIENNKQIELKPKNDWSEEKERELLEKQREQRQIEQAKLGELIRLRLLKNQGICVRVKFANNRSYVYNCRQEIKIGDHVKVDGKLSEIDGCVVGILGKWRLNENMKEVTEVISSI